MNTEKPEIIKKATLILWVTFGIGFVRTVMDIPRLSQHVAPGAGWFVHFAVLFIGLFSFAFTALLIYLIGERKNWARWLYVVLFASGIPLLINPLIQSLQHEPISGILSLI